MYTLDGFIFFEWKNRQKTQIYSTDLDVESLDRGGQRRVSDGTIETAETSSEAVKETKRYLPDSYNEESEDDDESDDSLSFDDDYDVEESIVINQSGPEATPQSGSNHAQRKIRRTLSEQLGKSNDTKIDIVETHSSSWSAHFVKTIIITR